MSNWILLYKSANFKKISETFSIDPVIARIIRNRGIVGEKNVHSYLFSEKKDMYDPFLLKDMKNCIAILIEKIKKGSKIRVIGDYDIDGICASYILYKGISQMGGLVDIVIPDRIKDGYGLNERLILEAKQDKIDTIITCDNGIAAFDSVLLAKKENITIIITDHHEVPFRNSKNEKEYILPIADAIVNPMQQDCSYPFKGICGALVAYKVIEALYINLKEEKKPLEELLGFAAFATIGDVMQLIDENRIVVKEGLSIIKNTKNEGLKALIKVCLNNDEKISPYHIGFILGPCVNATGRLDSARHAVQLFLTKSEEEALKIANNLKILNEERKMITKEGLEQAIIYVEENLKEDKVLVIYLENCHESIAGIVAGRIREKYKKPTFVLTKSKKGVKGSGRSIDTYNMYEKMSECEEWIEQYGGHKAAAGLSIKEENIDNFRKVLNEKCNLSKEDLKETIKIDLELPLSYVNMSLVKQFEKLEPFGMGNKKPLFAQKELKIISGKRLGKNGAVRKFIVEDKKGFRTELISFKEEEEIRKEMDHIFLEGTFEKLFNERKSEVWLHILYYPTINVYMGRESVQFVLEDFKPV